MAEGRIPELHQALQFRPWPGGDPFVVLEAIMARVDEAQQKQLMGLYLDSICATLDAHLKFAQGVRSIVAGGKAQR